MIILIGLVILLAAVVVGVAGVLTNGGDAHTLTDQFAVFGYHVTGSTGMVFLYGIVVGAVGLFGLGLLLAGARRTARRGRTARSELKQSRRETAAANQDRDDLAQARQQQTQDADADADHPEGSPS
jgi:ABC-type Na+ efflux pump permease subunit